MATRRTERPARRARPEPVLLRRWSESIAALGGGPRVVIGGKSMGGRIASMVADEVGAARPRVPRLSRSIRRASRRSCAPRTSRTLRTPALIVQGTRDAFGTREDVAGYTLSPAIRIAWLEGGDHSFKPPRSASGRTEAQNVEEAIAAAAAFVEGL